MYSNTIQKKINEYEKGQRVVSTKRTVQYLESGPIARDALLTSSRIPDPWNKFSDARKFFLPIDFRDLSILVNLYYFASNKMSVNKKTQVHF